MAGELIISPAPYLTGANIYFQVFSAAGQIWDTGASAFETYATASIGDYDIAATELGTASGIYQASMPAAPAGIVSAVARRRVGANPAETDPVVGVMTPRAWTGSAFVDVGDLATAEKLLAYVQLLARSDSAIATDRATELAEINADEGGGAGSYDNTAEALEAIRDSQFEAYVEGVVDDGSPTTSSFSGNPELSNLDGFYSDAKVTMAFVSGDLKPLVNRVTGYTGSTRTFTFATPWPAAPANGDRFILIGRIE